LQGVPFRSPARSRAGTSAGTERSGPESGCAGIPVRLAAAPAAAARTLAAALVFERDVDLGPIGFDLAVVELHVELDDFRDTQVAQRFRCPFDSVLGRILP